MVYAHDVRLASASSACSDGCNQPGDWAAPKTTGNGRPRVHDQGNVRRRFPYGAELPFRRSAGAGHIQVAKVTLACCAGADIRGAHPVRTMLRARRRHRLRESAPRRWQHPAPPDECVYRRPGRSHPTCREGIAQRQAGAPLQRHPACPPPESRRAAQQPGAVR
jgi:hypothetical protein